MALVALKSSAINAVEYYPKSRVLLVLFTDGTRRRYSGVPKKVFDELINAESAGKYFNYHIRDIYPYT